VHSGHNRAVDWWSLGALMFDMLTGAVSYLCAVCLSVCLSCGCTVQTRLDGSRSLVGWRLFGSQGT